MLKLMDCTLRDGANVVGKGFDAEITALVLKGLYENNIRTIEMGNALGVGAYAKGSTNALTDEEYFRLAQPYVDKAEIGMFMGWKNGSDEVIASAKNNGLSFLRVGANAGDGQMASEVVKRVKQYGLTCRYSLMKAYVLTPAELAKEAVLLEKSGVDELTIMDSAGTMKPDEAATYVRALKEAVRVPVAFHGHNNLGLATANALAAREAGADVIDACLMGMARSAGNIALEMVVALMQQQGELTDINFYGLLTFLDEELIPAMEKRGFRVPITPVDLIYGLAGAHSSFAKDFHEAAQQYHVNEYKLIMAVSAVNRKNPDKALIEKTAKELL